MAKAKKVSKETLYLETLYIDVRYPEGAEILETEELRNGWVADVVQWPDGHISIPGCGVSQFGWCNDLDYCRRCKEHFAPACPVCGQARWEDNGTCITCANIAKWRAERERQFKPSANCESKYGIRADEAREQFRSQGCKCPVCRTNNGPWRIDHVDTASGPFVRGILCNPRNSTVLGKHGDTPGGLYWAWDKDPDNQLLLAGFHYLNRTAEQVKEMNEGKYPYKVRKNKGLRAYQGEHPNIRRKAGEKVFIEDGKTTIYKTVGVWAVAKAAA